jgi:hypothetical protein
MIPAYWRREDSPPGRSDAVSAPRPPRLLDLDGCRFEYGTLLGHPPRLEPDGAVMVGLYRHDVEESGLPREEIGLRTFGQWQYYGRFMLRPKAESKPSLPARLVAVTLADQAGRALSTR